MKLDFISATNLERFVPVLLFILEHKYELELLEGFQFLGCGACKASRAALQAPRDALVGGPLHPQDVPSRA
ncbi:hypothetical protein [Pontibacter chitinilyticus]|uniref:hypothetical protein n=1 Tax=Pontibacter chitinilyticus TaxID=2674989 RepID=UPI003219917B